MPNTPPTNTHKQGTSYTHASGTSPTAPATPDDEPLDAGTHVVEIVKHRTDAWRTKLDQRAVTKGRGENAVTYYVTIPNFRNAAICIENEEKYADRLRFNEFSYRVEIDGRAWGEADILSAWEWMQEPDRLPTLTKKVTADAAAHVAHRHAYHPVRDYLSGLEHDGKPRIDTWLIDHAGAHDTPYVRAVSAKWLISAVARVMQPGCQVDTALIFESQQGTFKSSAISVLGEPWASPLASAHFGHGKDAMEQVLGKWLIEMGELSSMDRSEVSAIKDFLSRRNDYFRPSYGTVAEDHQRQCVFVGSTNDKQYLHDATGGRRFWPVEIGRFDVEALTEVRDQLWAEATARYKAKEPWHLSAGLEASAVEEQEQRRVGDPWEDIVGVYLTDVAAREAPGILPTVSVTNVLSLGLGLKNEQLTQAAQNRAVKILAALGWVICRPYVTDPVTGIVKQVKRYRPKQQPYSPDLYRTEELFNDDRV